jgi:hypothetical protein
MRRESLIRAAFAVIGASAGWDLCQAHGSVSSLLPAALVAVIVACGALKLPASARAAVADASREAVGVSSTVRLVVIGVSSLWFAASAITMREGVLRLSALVVSTLVLCSSLLLYNHDID